MQAGHAAAIPAHRGLPPRWRHHATGSLGMAMASILLTFLFVGPWAALVTRLHVDFSARGLVRLCSRRALLPGRRLANRKDRLVHPPSGCGRCYGSCQWVRRRWVLVRGPARRLRRWGRGRPGRLVRRFGGRCCGGHRRVVLAHPRRTHLGGICGPRLGRTVVRPTGWLEHLNRTSYPIPRTRAPPMRQARWLRRRSDPRQRHHLGVRENPHPKATNSGLRRCPLHRSGYLCTDAEFCGTGRRCWPG